MTGVQVRFSSTVFWFEDEERDWAASSAAALACSFMKMAALALARPMIHSKVR